MRFIDLCPACRPSCLRLTARESNPHASKVTFVGYIRSVASAERAAAPPCHRYGMSEEAPDERERSAGDLPPSAIDRERVPAVGHFNDLGHADVALLLLERRIRDRPGNRV